MRISIFKLFGLGVALALFALAAGQSGQVGVAQATCTATVSVGSPIQAAIDAASAGAVICVEAGEYFENLTINNKQDLTLQGAGRDQVTLDGSAGVADQKPAILIEKSQKITIKGFKIVKSRRAVRATESTGVVVADNRFENNLRQAVSFIQTEGQLTNNLIQKTNPDGDGTRGEGVNLGDSQVSLKDNTISNNAFLGIVAQGLSDQSGSAITIEKNTIARNVEEGLFVGGSAKAQITNNQIMENKPNPQEKCCGFGINLRNNAQATIQGNTVGDNLSIGIVLQENAKATIEDNTINRNMEAGIFLNKTADATIIKNRITGNRPTANGSFGRGIEALNASHAVVRDNTISSNASTGIVLTNDVQFTIVNNTIQNNSNYGIFLGFSDTQKETIRAEISTNAIQNNRNCGVSTDNDSGIKITGKDNTIASNSRGNLCGDTSKFPAGFGGGK